MQHNNKHMKYVDRYLYLVHKVSIYPFRCKKSERPLGVRLNYALLSSILGSGIAPLIIKNLIQWKVIERVGGYEPGRKSYSYILCEPYRSAKLIHINQPNSDLDNRIKLKKSPPKNSLMKFLFESIQRVSFDWDHLQFEFDGMDIKETDPLYLLVKEEFNRKSVHQDEGLSNESGVEFESGMKILNENEVKGGGGGRGASPTHENDFTHENDTKACGQLKMDQITIKSPTSMTEEENKAYSCLLSVYAILTGDLYLKHKKHVGRVYTNFSNLKSRLRETLVDVNGKKLYEVDITNSQPFFLAVALIKHYRKLRKVWPEDVKRYIVLAEIGKLYEHFITDEPQFANRDLVKGQFIRNGMYCRNQQAEHSEFFSRLKSEFPSVAEFIWNSKRQAHNKLAIMLQREESLFMIDFMGEQFRIRNSLYVTVHDSALMYEELIPAFERYAKKYFEPYGVLPKFKPKS